MLGDGLFETVLAERSALVDWAAHMERLADGCAALGLPAPDPAACTVAAQAALQAADLEDARAAVRLTWTAGGGGRGLDRPEPVAPRLYVAASPAAETREPATLALSAVRRNAGSPTSRWKTLSYLDNVLARAEARAQGADEAVMLDGDGQVACAAAANLFWVTGGRLFTPDTACGALAGTVRRRVLDAATDMGVEAAEVRAGPEALDEAEAVFLTNSLARVRAVRAFAGRSYGPSALVEALAEAARG